MKIAPTKIAIVGAGKGGIAIMELLHQIPDVEIVGIADRNPAAPGLKRARDLNVQVAERIQDLIQNHGVNLIMDVTGDPSMGPLIHATKRPGSEVLSGATTRLVWNLVQHQSKLEAELFQADKLAGLGSFAAGIAHDINNPLQLILGLAENLTEEDNLAAVKEQARDIAEAVKRTSAICRDLTSYARRNGAEEAACVNLNTKMDEALKIARYAVTLQDITVVKQYAEHATVTGNPDELLHVFVNLITNGVQAIENRGTLTLQTAVGPNGEVTASVSDTGCGIPKNVLSKIFEPLFTTKPPGKGTGLGLYNVMSVISKMEGRISVESEVGIGTTFHIEFPHVRPTIQCEPQ
ncbi:MAG: putative Histidine kinase [Nitrospira sp.]|jgi:signal transduction histidine kinase|nr:putative Histidine kinase [Nitrospira sp.]